MAPAAPSPLLKLFGVDHQGPGQSLQHIRDKIYSSVWSRVRRDDHKLDFVVSENGVNRNVPERSFHGEVAYGAIHAPPPPCNLHLVNKQISKDFTRYIYSVNDLEVDVDLKALYSIENQAALNKIATLLRNPNFQKHTRNVRVRIHFPAQYSAVNLPQFNQSALENIALAFGEFKHLGHLAIRMVPGQGAPLDYELRLSAFPFYPMRMTNWSIRILNAATLPYKWDSVNAREYNLLDQAYKTYLQTGSLTAPVIQNLIENQPTMASLRLKVGGLPQSLSTFRQPVNGSQKRRERKNKAAGEAEEASIHASGSNVDSSGSAANVTQSTKIGAEKKSVDAEAESPYSAAGKTDAKELSLDPENAPKQVTDIEHSRLTLALSPPSSPAQETELEQSTGPRPIISTTLSSPPASSDGKPISDTVVLNETDVNAQQIHPTASPAPSSATLVPIVDVSTVERDDDAEDDSKVTDGDTAQLQQAKKKRRNKGSKKNKTKSKAVQSAGNCHDASLGYVEAIEMGVAMIDQEHVKSSSDMATQVEEATAGPSSSDPNRFDLSQGTWSSFGATHAIFTRTETGVNSIFVRTPRIERYLRQQERVLTARAETGEWQKQAKAKQQARKARQILLRRDHIATNSPLARSKELPRDDTRQRAKSQAQSSILEPDEDLGQLEDEYHKNLAEQQKLEEKIRQTKSKYKRELEKIKDNLQRVAESQNGVDRGIPPQHNSGRAQEHRFKFEIEIDIDTDDSSVDSITQEHPDTNTAVDLEEGPGEASQQDDLNRHLRPHEISQLGLPVSPMALSQGDNFDSAQDSEAVLTPLDGTVFMQATSADHSGEKAEGLQDAEVV